MHSSLLLDANGQQLNRAFVQYCFDRHEHSVELKPHGNSKSKKPLILAVPNQASFIVSKSQLSPRHLEKYSEKSKMNRVELWVPDQRVTFLEIDSK